MNGNNLYYRPEYMPEAFEPYVRPDGVIDFDKDSGNPPIPSPFLEMDRYLRATGVIKSEYNKEDKIIREVSMKEICEKKFGYNPNIKGPLNVTDDFIKEYNMKKVKEESNRKKEEIKVIDDYRKEMLLLITTKERLYSKLVPLNIKRKGDAEKIAKINARILKINDDLLRLEKESGIKISELTRNNVSKVSIFLNKIKKTYKKVKNFIKKYSEPIITGLLVIASFFVPKFLRRLFPLPA